MIKKYFLGLSIALLLTACPDDRSETLINNGEVESNANCSTFKHEVGETEICDRPQRIVVLNPKMLDILLSLEVQPIGYAEVFSDRQGDFDRPSQQIPYLGDRITQPIADLGISSEPSLEALARLKPDLILGDSAGNKEEYARLAQIAPTLLFDYVGADEWQVPLQVIADVLERGDRARTVLETYTQQLETARQALAPVAERYPKVLMLSSEEVTSSINLVTSADFCGKLLENLGFQLVELTTNESTNINQPISVEVLPQLGTDIIIIQGHNINALSQIDSVDGFESRQLQTTKQTWAASPIAQSLQASKDNRVYFIPTYLCLGLPSPTGAKLLLQQLQDQLSPLSVNLDSN